MGSESSIWKLLVMATMFGQGSMLCIHSTRPPAVSTRTSTMPRGIYHQWNFFLCFSFTRTKLLSPKIYDFTYDFTIKDF